MHIPPCRITDRSQQWQTAHIGTCHAAKAAMSRASQSSPIVQQTIITLDHCCSLLNQFFWLAVLQMLSFFQSKCRAAAFTLHCSTRELLLQPPHCFVSSYALGNNLAVTNGTPGRDSASLGNIYEHGPGSTVKHVDCIWPECLVGDEVGDNDRGSNNLRDMSESVDSHALNM